MSKFAVTTSTPSSTRALVASPDTLRVKARTFHSDFRRAFTTDPPCVPVAPWTAIILVMVGICEWYKRGWLVRSG